MRRKVPAGDFWTEVNAYERSLPPERLLRLVGSFPPLPASLEHEFQRPTKPETCVNQQVVLPEVAQDALPDPDPLLPAPSHPKPQNGSQQPATTRCEQGATPIFDRLTPTIRRPSMDEMSKSWVRPRPIRLPEEQREPVHLTVLQIPEVRRSKDVFRCDVFEAHIRARTCLARQYTARELEKVGRGAARQRLGPKTQYAACLNCPVGQQLQKQVVAVDKGDVMKKVVKVRDGRLPKRYASGPDRD